MIKRTVEVGSQARLRLNNRHLLVDRPELPDERVPIEDLGVLIIDHHQVSLSQPLLVACAEAGAMVVVCDARHLPVGQFSAFATHALHAKVVASQANAAIPNRKRLWQRIVQAKIAAQARCLNRCIGNDGELPTLLGKVRSGDPANVEAQAARRYWPLLYGNEFRRDPDLVGLNAALNYGYAIVRAALSRAIVGTGLHPALGVHHQNQYNAFCLADDLIEPLRPLVDAEVFAMRKEGTIADGDLNRPTRHRLLRLLTSDLTCAKRSLTLPAALSCYTASVARVLTGEDQEPIIPRIP